MELPKCQPDISDATDTVYDQFITTAAASLPIEILESTGSKCVCVCVCVCVCAHTHKSEVTLSANNINQFS